jgi:beta-glucuronidase
MTWGQSLGRIRSRLPRLILAGTLLSVLAALGAAGPAAAQPGYQATPPTKGALANDGPAGRYLLGGTWLYRPDVGNVGLAGGWWRNIASTEGWNPVSIPNSYNAGQLTKASMNGWVGWYRRDFTLPTAAFNGSVPRADRKWIIQFESVDYGATVWINGHRLGEHQIGYLPFQFVLNHLRRGVNRLVVRVDDRRTGADFPPGPGGGWWNFGGILDAVYLRPVQRADLDSVVIRPELPCPSCAATIFEQATVRNLTSHAQKVQLRGRYGDHRLNFGRSTIPAGATWSPTATVRISHPKLWGLFSPRLYKATDTLSDRSGRWLGGYVWESGIREIHLTRSGRLDLNGRALSLRGFSIHEQTATTGAALDVPQMQQLISWAQELGAGIIREHYPEDPELEEMADRAGILLWSEVPVYQSSDSQFRSAAWRRRAEALLRDSIQANQNHPAILLWSIGNEFPLPPTSGQATYIRQAVRDAHRLDPTRPVGLATMSWPNIPCESAYKPLEVIGFNEYFGWFDSGDGSNDDRDQFSPYLDALHKCYPHKAVVISEWGFGADRTGPVEDRGTYAYQIDEMRFALNVFATKPWLTAAIYFPMQDFAAKPGFDGGDPLGHPPIVDKGVLDRFGNPKPSFAVMQSIYRSTQQIAPAR